MTINFMSFLIGYSFSISHEQGLGNHWCERKNSRVNLIGNGIFVYPALTPGQRLIGIGAVMGSPSPSTTGETDIIGLIWQISCAKVCFFMANCLFLKGEQSIHIRSRVPLFYLSLLQLPQSIQNKTNNNVPKTLCDSVGDSGRFDTGHLMKNSYLFFAQNNYSAQS